MDASNTLIVPDGSDDRCEITELLRTQCAHCRIPAPSPVGMRARVYDEIASGTRPTADGLAETLGISVATVHAHIGSLRSGRTDDDGKPGRPSSGPDAPVFIACEFDQSTGRHEYVVPETVEGGNVYSVKRQRMILTQLRRLGKMLGVWQIRYPQDVVTRVAYRGVTRLIEDLSDVVARQEEMSV